MTEIISRILDARRSALSSERRPTVAELGSRAHEEYLRSALGQGLSSQRFAGLNIRLDPAADDDAVVVVGCNVPGKKWVRPQP
jgi:uncharacterized protein with von Willebrand factor type A (vWA) domain